MDSAVNLRTAMRESITLTELQHATGQLRLVAILLAGSLFFDLMDPALLLLGSHKSLVFQVASATRLGPGGFAVLFLCLAALLLPYVLVNAFWPECPWRRPVTQLACHVLIVGGVAWEFLAYRSLALDLGAAPAIFLRTGIGALGFAFALGLSLNAEQLRNLMEKPR
jgi:hypothetical protein